MTINGVEVVDNRCHVTLITYDMIFTKEMVLENILKNEFVRDRLATSTFYGELRSENFGRRNYMNRFLKRFTSIDSDNLAIRINGLYSTDTELQGDITLVGKGLSLNGGLDYRTAYRMLARKNENNEMQIFSFITFDLVYSDDQNDILMTHVKGEEMKPVNDVANSNRIIKLNNKKINILNEIIYKSRLPSKESSIEITAIEKAEEEVIELLFALRRLKDNYSLKSIRKNYDKVSRLRAFDAVIEELGDVIVDAIYGLSVTLAPPGILYRINERIRSKFAQYKAVLDEYDKEPEEAKE
jgi:hypothetical protein